MAVARVRELTFVYGGATAPALSGVSLTIEPGEIMLLAGHSGSGKTTLVRALAGLVPHFHGGRFGGSVEVGGRDTRQARPAELAGTVATLFQEPEDQIVFGGVAAEVAFGIENAGAPPDEIEERALAALRAVGVAQLAARPVRELSGGELQRVCLASTLALEPDLLLLDEPTSQLDEDGAAALLLLLRRLARERGTAVVVSEQRVARALELADRVIVLDEGKVTLDAGREDARRGLEAAGLTFDPPQRLVGTGAVAPGEPLVAMDGVGFAYAADAEVLDGVGLTLRRGEVVALTGRNGSGKSTLARLVAGLLEPTRGTVTRSGRAGFLPQDAGRFLVRERCDDEVALGARGGRESVTRALEAVGLAGFGARHPRDLSSGERERLAVAAVLASDPDVLVLDEPTRGVDPGARERLAALLQAQTECRATLLVTHDLALAGAVADRTISLDQRAERVAA